jgi:hypothetical protein
MEAFDDGGSYNYNTACIRQPFDVGSTLATRR